MKIVKPIILILVIGLMAFHQVEAQQKFGHINSVELLYSMPDAKDADTELKKYQEQLTAEGQGMLDKWEKEAADLYKKVQEGTITPKDQATEEAALQKKQQELIAFEQDAAKKLRKKEEELLGPILKKANEAITKVATDNGYTMIFDTSVGILVHVEEGDNILALVKKSLNIP